MRRPSIRVTGTTFSGRSTLPLDLGVNKVVVGIMKKWMVESVKGALLGLPEEERAVSRLQSNLAMLLYDQGKLSEAEPLMRETLEGKRLTVGNTHSDTLISINNLASLL